MTELFKCLIICNKDFPKLDSKIFVPIQVGKDLSCREYNMIGDNTGDNISILNKRFCETTAIYWAWKNYKDINNPKYVGFMHYRRHFLFSNNVNYKSEYFGLVKFKNFSEQCDKEILSDKDIESLVSKYDLIVPEKIDIKKLEGKSNNYEHYSFHHNINDLNSALSILLKKYPEYDDVVSDFKKSDYAYFFNMFIMRKEIFFEYCEWLFSILFELHYSTFDEVYDKYQDRKVAFISERLTDIFIRKKLSENKSYLELKVSFIESNNYYYSLEKEIPIVLSSNNFFIPYLEVCLASIVEFSSSKNNYHIFILNSDVSEFNKNTITKGYSKKNICIDFIKMDNTDCFSSTIKHISVDTYSRIFIPNLLQNYNKCIYLDCDTVVQRDLADLYNVDLRNKSVAVVRNATVSGWMNLNQNLRKYIKSLCNDESAYFQAGVIVYNLDKCRKNNDSNKLLKMYLNKGQEFWKFVDQDLLNKYYYEDVLFLDQKWNYEVEHPIMEKQHFVERMPIPILQKYIEARKSPYIIHFQGQFKPWNSFGVEFEDVWWSFAKKTHFFYKILLRFDDFLHENKEIYRKELIKTCKTISKSSNKLDKRALLKLSNTKDYYQKQLDMNV